MTQHIAIIGAGAAGTLLARALVLHNINESAQIHIYDHATEPGARNGRWCLWARDNDPLAGLFSYNWPNMAYRDDLVSLQKGLHDYRYAEIEWRAFFASMHDWLGAQTNIHWHLGKSMTCSSGADKTWAVDDGAATQAFDYIFDSRPPDVTPMLYQHFTGWLVDMDDSVFDADEVILMDFLTPPEDKVRFFYILPQSEKRALVEVTYLSHTPFDDTASYETPLHNYLAARYPGIGHDTGAPCETGAIPLYARPPVHSQPGYVPIGARGGAVRGASGYGFKHMRDHASAIAAALAAGDTPPGINHVITPATRWMDRIFMRVMLRQPQHAAWIFRTMFARLPGDTIARFLMCDADDWRAKWRIIRAMPKRPFLRGALWPF